MAYTLDDLDNAIANSIGPVAWAATGPGDPGFCRPILMQRAAFQRWFDQRPEDGDSAVLREAYVDLAKDGCLRPVGGWEDTTGEAPWE